jgi:uncharacterized DUF497 family protein
MKISFDAAKREKTRQERGVDFQDAREVFAGRHYSQQSAQEQHNEIRIVTVGFLQERMVIIVWTPRGETHHIISMRKANAREQRRYAPLFWE